MKKEKVYFYLSRGFLNCNFSIYNMTRVVMVVLIVQHFFLDWLFFHLSVLGLRLQ